MLLIYAQRMTEPECSLSTPRRSDPRPRARARNGAQKTRGRSMRGRSNWTEVVVVWFRVQFLLLPKPFIFFPPPLGLIRFPDIMWHTYDWCHVYFGAS